MIQGKSSYDKIEVPEGVTQVFQDACKRGKRTVMKKRITKAGMTMAACFCLVVFTGNETVYATLSEIPVIGQVVQFIHTGKGGLITDGASGYSDAVEGILQVHFNGNADNTPHYEVEYLKAPNRVQITLDGVRNFDRDGLKTAANEVEGIQDVYFITYLDDSAIRFVVELQDGYNYEVKEYSNPGYLEICLKQDQEISPETSGWFIRSDSAEMGESLAIMQETFDHWNSEVTKTENGLFAVVVGPFAEKSDAERVLEEMGTAGDAGQFVIEELKGGRLK